MNTDLYVAIALSELVSLFLIVRLLFSKRSFLERLIFTVILLVPFMGPFFYFIIVDDEPRKVSILPDTRLSFGEYTRIWITFRPLLKKIYQEKKDSLERSDPKEDETN